MQRCRARDFYELPPSREILPGTGFLRAPAKINRTGIQQYTARELGLDGGDSKILRLWRPPEEVAKAVKTFESATVTDEHPPNGVDAVNWHLLAKGDVRDCSMAGDFTEAVIIVRDQSQIDLVKDGKAELSCGYEFSLDMTSGTTPAGEQYDAVQRDIVGNHVAIVDRGRAGSRVRIADRKGQTTMLIRLKAADTAIGKITIPGLDKEIEIADAAVARAIVDSFDLHKHGIEAAKDAHDKLMKDHKDLQAAFDEYKSGMEEAADDDDDDAVADPEHGETEEMEAAEEEEGGAKKAADGHKIGYTKDGKPTWKYRLRRALDSAKKWRAKAEDTSAHEKLAEERAAVLDAAKVFLGEEFEAKGKTVHDIRLAAIVAAGKDEGLKDIVTEQLDGVKPEKLAAKDAGRIFRTIVKIGGRTVGARDDGGDQGVSKAMLQDAIAAATGGNAGGGSFGRDLFLSRNAQDSRTKGRPVEDKN